MRDVCKMVLVCLTLALGLSASDSKAQDYAALLRDFNASALTYNERRWLQTALAFEGHYFGLLDGDWGKLSRDAMQGYARQEFGTPAEEWHMAVLAMRFFDRYEQDGWDMHYFPALGMSVMLPQKALVTEPDTKLFANLRHATSSLAISIGRHDRDTASSIHSFTLDAHAVGSPPYSVRKTDFAVSSATLADGSGLYTRSHFIDGAWSTVMVSAQRGDIHTYGAVTSSITKGRAAPLDITADGKLINVVRETLALVNADDPDATAIAPTPQEPSPRGSGTGFVVSENGHVLTNAHVVAGCSSIMVDGIIAALVDSSEAFDLALLQTALSDDKAVAVFSASPARLNSDVTVIGFPYADLLGGLNVTRGSVSSLKGLRGDGTRIQITAPVQSGNSGGPLLAADGEVVGVVVSKLDAMVMAQNSGDVPQNVNFAIRGEIAKLFLAQNQIEARQSLDDIVIPPEELAKSAARFTTFIECR